MFFHYTIYMMKHLLLVFLTAACTAAQAQDTDRSALQPLRNLGYKVEMQSSLSKGTTPLWLNANRYGMSSLRSANALVRASVERPLRTDSLRRWGIGYGLDVAAAWHYPSTAIVQQAYVEARWLHGTLTIGSKQHAMPLQNNELSSGAQTFGINARPIPQVRLAVDRWKVFGLRWLYLSGHISYGRLTDGNWQAEFTRGKNRYAQGTLYHSKAGYLHIGNPDSYRPLSADVGVEMGTLFGGKSHVQLHDGSWMDATNQGGLKGMLQALFIGGSDVTDGTYVNAAGDHLGSWVARVNYDKDLWSFSLYYDKFFEDHSSMLQLDYDGYGTGEEWDVAKKRSYLLYDFSDMLLGAELRWKYGTWLRNIVVEYLHTKYQSGPIYHDHSAGMSDHIGGQDEYYNHGIYAGWQHWGQVIGNPLYRSPLYNTDGKILIENNRFTAWHLGISGAPTERLSYRFLASYQEGYGTYSVPYTKKHHNVSMMLEAAYTLPHNVRIKAAAGADFGAILGQNRGIQLSISKTGLFKKTRR